MIIDQRVENGDGRTLVSTKVANFDSTFPKIVKLFLYQ